MKIVVIIISFLSLGFLSACSDLKKEVVSNKEATSEARVRTYSGIRAEQSLWNVGYRQSQKKEEH